MNERKNKSKATHVKEFSVGGEGTRIHKLLAHGGFGSRREIEKAIVEKKIYVNNQSHANEEILYYINKFSNEIEEKNLDFSLYVYCYSYLVLF